MKLLITIMITMFCSFSHALSFVCFQKTVAASATPEALGASSYKIMSGTIQALSANTGTITLIQKGGTYGIVLDAGKAYNLALSGIDGVYDLSQVYLKASVNGEGINFCGFTKP